MSNPFRLRWLQGWTFQVVLMEGHVQVEAHGFGICLRTAVMPGESPQAAADRLVLSEDRRRRALHNAWLRGQDMAQPAGLHPRRNQHRTRIRWWWLARPIANGWPDLLMRSKLRQQPGQAKACSTEA